MHSQCGSKSAGFWWSQLIWIYYDSKVLKFEKNAHRACIRLNTVILIFKYLYFIYSNVQHPVLD